MDLVSQDCITNTDVAKDSVVSEHVTHGHTHTNFEDLIGQVYGVLDATEATGNDVQVAVNQLFHGLLEIRKDSSREQWKDLITRGRAHRVCQLVHQDPFTSRAFAKPRGYAGDAVMMDYIYSHEENWPRPKATPLGRSIFDYTTAAPASAGVRERRCYVSEMLDNVARTRSGQDVLAVAAGHLREASLSSGVRRGRFGRFVAMDADQNSLKEIGQCYGRYGIEPVVANVRRMLTGGIDLGSFDLIYTTGLYDYLAESTAQRLTANLFDCVRPGGKLMIANFLPDICDVGYMEMFMDWHLIYRSRGDMLVLADQVPQSSVDEIRIVVEENENVVIMEMTKR